MFWKQIQTGERLIKNAGRRPDCSRCAHAKCRQIQRQNDNQESKLAQPQFLLDLHIVAKSCDWKRPDVHSLLFHGRDPHNNIDCIRTRSADNVVILDIHIIMAVLNSRRFCFYVGVSIWA